MRWEGRERKERRQDETIREERRDEMRGVERKNTNGKGKGKGKKKKGNKKGKGLDELTQK